MLIWIQNSPNLGSRPLSPRAAIARWESSGTQAKIRHHEHFAKCCVLRSVLHSFWSRIFWSSFFIISAIFTGFFCRDFRHGWLVLGSQRCLQVHELQQQQGAATPAMTRTYGYPSNRSSTNPNNEHSGLASFIETSAQCEYCSRGPLYILHNDSL